MAIISSDLLKEGMVLSSVVKNEQGQVLFAKGLELKPKHIDMIMAWGVPEVDIERDDEDAEGEAARFNQMLEEEMAQIHPRFSRCDPENKTVQEIIKLIAERKVEQRLRVES
jgi:hypothetical protein